MAREATTSTDLRGLAKKIGGISAAIEDMASLLETNSVPSVRLHLGMLTKRLIPEMEHWLDVAQLNSKDDVRSYLLGIESKSVLQKRYDENRKRAAAKRADAPAKKESRPSKKTT